ncbi:hypothetical protein NBRC110019_10460 [Neptunitalea chrysea]|uniref:PKD domain-containing protein n=1 Tax=Neptunitalea chrysea TaxID=1647581 RepID=A0A9W6B524_9FLAO|nr:PKD domain-containing protein [Neptunitalea chrysea]GLB52007.1 hypothetical protein NBRC110019_10460 [Neptunitalea chrysea]
MKKTTSLLGIFLIICLNSVFAYEGTNPLKCLDASLTSELPNSIDLYLKWNTDVSCQENSSEKTKTSIHSTSDIVDGECIRVCENSSVIYTIIGDTSYITSASWQITGGSINSQSSTTCNVSWGSAINPQGYVSVTCTLSDGTEKTIELCIEKIDAPKALFTVAGAPVICMENETIFDNLSSPSDGNSVLYYYWDFGDGNSSTEFEPTHQYTAAGIYYVILTVTNGCGCSSTYKYEIQVSNGISSIDCPSVVCEGQQATYTISNYAGQCSYNWTVNGGTLISSNNGSATILWDNVGSSGYGTVNIASSCTNCISTIEVPVVTSVGSIVGDTVLCTDEQATFSLPQWPTTEYNWSIISSTGAYLVYTNQRNEIIVNTVNSGQITLNCSYNNTLLGCGGSATITLEVLKKAEISGLEEVCQNTSTTYSALYGTSAITPSSWSLSTPTGTTITGSGSSFTYSFPTSGTYVLSIISSNYCSDPIYINVKASPNAPTAIIGEDEVCPDISETYSVTVPSGLTAHWSVTNGSILGSDTGSEITAVFDSNYSSYEVNVWYEKEGCSSSVLTLPIAKDVPTLSISGPINTCGSSTQTYTTPLLDDVDSYEWSIDATSSGSIIAGQNTNSVQVLWNNPSTNPSNADVKLIVRKCNVDYNYILPVTIVESPEVTINTVGNITDVCADETVNFTISHTGSANITSVDWDFAGTYETSTSGSQDHTFLQPTGGSVQQTITATVYFDQGCLPATATYNMIVSPSPVITISPEQNYNYCANNSDSTYTVNIQSGFGATTNITWYYSTSESYTGTILTGNTDTIDLSGAATGYYYAVVTNEYQCTAYTDFIRVYCSNQPGCVANETITASVTQQGCGSFLINYTASGNPVSVGIPVNSDLYDYVVTNTSTYAEIEDAPAGQYAVSITAIYLINGQYCSINETVIIDNPYVPGIKYNVTCGTNGDYEVQLLDFSEVYNPIGVDNFSFTFDGGSNWYAATNVSTNPQYNVTLSPGIYHIGVKLETSGYSTCTAFDELVLPDMSTFDMEIVGKCMKEPIYFYPTGVPSGSSFTYLWTFPYATNSLESTAYTFDTDGTYQVTLKVTNEFGCYTEITKILTVVDPDLDGYLAISPIENCEGSNVDITFINSATMPTEYSWYKDDLDNFIQTTQTNTITVNSSGHYFVYVTSNESCTSYAIPAIDINQVPIPETPVIKGPDAVCLGEDVELSVSASSNLTYYWSINGTLQSSWTGLTEVTDTPTVAGTYTYSVIAEVTSALGTTCTSDAGVWEVTVDAPLTPPIITYTLITCDPYMVKVNVTNVDSGAQYYWSNGDTGSDTTVYHDGPLEVRVEKNSCSATSQIDLPIDVEALAWIVPTGCVELCDSISEDAYLIGPLGSYHNWQWDVDYQPAGNSGIGTVGEQIDFSYGQSPNIFQLTINNEGCDYTMGELDLSRVDCSKCEHEYSTKLIKTFCEYINGDYVIKVEYNVYSTSPYTTTIQFSVDPSSAGYTGNSTITLSPYGSSNGYFYYFPASGTAGTTVSFIGQITGEPHPCIFKSITIEVPECGDNKRIALSTDTTLEEKLIAAPNPAHQSTSVYYYTPAENTLSLIVTNLSGQTVAKIALPNNEGVHELNCSDWNSGTYIISLHQNGNTIKSIKFVVK